MLPELPAPPVTDSRPLTEFAQALLRLPRTSADAFRAWGWRHVAFYVGVPVILALYTTVNNWELLRAPGFLGSLAFHAAHSTVPWWLNAGICWLLFVLVPWFTGHRVALIVTGTTIASVLMLPYADAVSTGFYTWWAVQDLHPALHADAPADLIDGFLMYLVRAAVLTLGVNWIFDRFLGLPRYRREYVPSAAAPLESRDTPDSAGTSPEAGKAVRNAGRPRFLDRLPESVTAESVLAIKAEQHYIRVFAGERSWMTLYRFSDALAEMADLPGLQVHRSYWVRPEFIAKIRQGGGRMLVHLRSGMEVPVSGPYKVLVRQMASREQVPILPLTT